MLIGARISGIPERSRHTERRDGWALVGDQMTSVGANIQRSLSPGTEVEVLTRYQGRWATGFEIDAVHDDRYLLRRRSDNTVLPAAFAVNQIRPRR
jgi:hypothetical protein